MSDRVCEWETGCVNERQGVELETEGVELETEGVWVRHRMYIIVRQVTVR